MNHAIIGLGSLKKKIFSVKENKNKKPFRFLHLALHWQEPSRLLAQCWFLQQNNIILMMFSCLLFSHIKKKQINCSSWKLNQIINLF